MCLTVDYPWAWIAVGRVKVPVASTTELTKFIQSANGKYFSIIEFAAYLLFGAYFNSLLTEVCLPLQRARTYFTQLPGRVAHSPVIARSLWGQDLNYILLSLGTQVWHYPDDFLFDTLVWDIQIIQGAHKKRMGHCLTHRVRPPCHLDEIPENYWGNWRLLSLWHCQETAVDSQHPQRLLGFFLCSEGNIFLIYNLYTSPFMLLLAN